MSAVCLPRPFHSASCWHSFHRLSLWRNVLLPDHFDEPQDFAFVCLVYCHFLWLSLLHVAFTLLLFPASVLNKRELIYYNRQSFLSHVPGKSLLTKRFGNLFAATKNLFEHSTTKDSATAKFFLCFQNSCGYKCDFYGENNQNASNSLFAFEHKQLQTQHHFCVSSHSAENRLMRKINVQAENCSYFIKKYFFQHTCSKKLVNKKLSSWDKLGSTSLSQTWLNGRREVEKVPLFARICFHVAIDTLKVWKFLSCTFQELSIPSTMS